MGAALAHRHRREPGRGRDMAGCSPIAQAGEGELAALGAERRGIEQGPFGARERRVLRLGEEVFRTVVFAVFDRGVRLGP
jgi:hypothetical protein